MGKSSGDLITNGQVITSLLDTDYFYLWRSSGSAGLRDQMMLKTDFESYFPLRWSDLIGCQCTPGTDPTTDIYVTAGKRRDSTDTVNLTCPAGTVAIDATFDAGTSTWGLYSGASLSAGDTVHLMAVSIDAGGVGYYFDDDISGANLPSGCTYFRRLTSRRMATSTTIIPDIQRGHTVISGADVATYLVDLSGTQVTTATAFELPNVPGGLTLPVTCTVGIIETDTTYTHIFGEDEEDYTPSVSAYTLSTSNARASVEITSISDVDAQLYRRSAATTAMTSFNVFAKSWYDDLGVFDGV